MSSPQTVKLSHIQKTKLYDPLLTQISEYMKVGDGDEQRKLQQHLLDLIKKKGLVSEEVLQAVADYQEKRMLIPGLFGQFTILHREVRDALLHVDGKGEEKPVAKKKRKKTKKTREELAAEAAEEEEEPEEEAEEEAAVAEDEEEDEDWPEDDEDEEEDEEEDEDEDEDEEEDEDEDEDEEEAESERFVVQEGTGARKYAVVDTETGEVMTTTGKEAWAEKLAAKWNKNPPETEEEEEEPEEAEEDIEGFEDEDEDEDEEEDEEEGDEDEDDEEEDEEDDEDEEEGEEEEDEDEEDEGDDEEGESEDDEEADAEEEEDEEPLQAVAECYELDEAEEALVLPLGDKKYKAEGLKTRKRKGVVFPTPPHLKWARACNASKFFEVVAAEERSHKDHWKLLKARGLKRAAFDNQWAGWLGGYFKKDGYHLVEVDDGVFQIQLDIP